MTIFYTEIRSNAAEKLYKALNHLISEIAPFSQIKKLLLFAVAFLLFAGVVTPAAAQVNITYGGSNPVSNYTVAYAVTFTTTQTGLSASNFTVTGTATGAYVSSVTAGSGTSWSVNVTIPNSFQSSGTVILNMVNSTGISPGVSGLPVASPTVNDVLYPLTGSMTLSSSNANPGYAKSGDIIFVVVRSDYYGINQINGAVDNQTFNGSGSGSSGDGYVTLGAGAPQGPLTYAWQFVTSFSTNGNGSGTSSIIYDSQAPTVNISAPSASIVAGNGTSSVSYTITYADVNFNTSNLTASGITLNTTGTATGTVGVTGSGTTYTVTVSNITGAGTLGISVGAGYASDMAGNADTGAGPSSTVAVLGNISPSISYAGPQVYPINTAISPLTPGAAINTSVFGNTTAGTGLALDYNGNAYIISSSSEIIQYQPGNANAFPLPANSTANPAIAPISGSTSTLLTAFNGAFRAMDITNGQFSPPVTACSAQPGGVTLIAAVHPSSGPEIAMINRGYDAGGQLAFLTRTGGTWSSPALISNAFPGPAIAINNYPGGLKLAYIGTDNNLYYATYSGGTWSAVSPWGTPNISLSGVTAFALDAQGDVWYGNGAALNELAPGSTSPITVATLPSAPTPSLLT